MSEFTSNAAWAAESGSEEYHVRQPHCLQCGKEMVYGRPDRKFCSSQCKNRWHNHINVAPRLSKMRVQHILEKNYRILSSFVSAGVSSVPVSSLLVMGFNPLYYTSSIKQRRGQMCMCFDLTYCLTESKLYKLGTAEQMPK